MTRDRHQAHHAIHACNHAKLLDPIDNDDSNDSYEESLIECKNEESLDYSNNQETGSKTDDEEIE
ncbi:33385_t:CDS:2, partial [Gigaspora margarita]